MTDLGRSHHMHDRDDLMAEQVRDGRTNKLVNFISISLVGGEGAAAEA